MSAKTQYPWLASNGDIVCQLSVMLANSPWTSTTGRGCAALGRHDQLFAPGGGVPGCSAAAATLAENRYGTGYCAAAWAVAGPIESAAVATIAAPINLNLASRIRIPLCRCARVVRRNYPAVGVVTRPHSHRRHNSAGALRPGPVLRGGRVGIGGRWEAMASFREHNSEWRGATRQGATHGRDPNPWSSPSARCGRAPPVTRDHLRSGPGVSPGPEPRSASSTVRVGARRVVQHLGNVFEQLDAAVEGAAVRPGRAQRRGSRRRSAPDRWPR